MKKPKTRIGILRRALRPYGVTQQKLADLAGCAKITVDKWERKERPLTEPYAIRIAHETGVSPQWLIGQGRRFPIRAMFQQRWAPDWYTRTQEAKLNSVSIQGEADLAHRHFLLTMARVGRILLAGLRKKQTALAVDRLTVALGKVALEFGITEQSKETADNAVLILRRHRSGKHLISTARLVTNRFRRAIKQTLKHRQPVDVAVALGKKKPAARQRAR